MEQGDGSRRRALSHRGSGGAKPSNGVDARGAGPGAGVRRHPLVPPARDPPRAPAWKPELWSLRGSGPGRRSRQLLGGLETRMSLEIQQWGLHTDPLCIIPSCGGGHQGSSGLSLGCPLSMGERHSWPHLMGGQGHQGSERKGCPGQGSGWTSSQGGVGLAAHSQTRVSWARPPVIETLASGPAEREPVVRPRGHLWAPHTAPSLCVRQSFASSPSRLTGGLQPAPWTSPEARTGRRAHRPPADSCRGLGGPKSIQAGAPPQPLQLHLGPLCTPVARGPDSPSTTCPGPAGPHFHAATLFCGRRWSPRTLGSVARTCPPREQRRDGGGGGRGQALGRGTFLDKSRHGGSAEFRTRLQHKPGLVGTGRPSWG